MPYGQAIDTPSNDRLKGFKTKYREAVLERSVQQRLTNFSVPGELDDNYLLGSTVSTKQHREASQMHNKLDENAQLDVEINNLWATDGELEKLRGLIAQGLGTNATTLSIRSMSNTPKGTRYDLQFRVLNPKHFNPDQVKDWLHQALLVGWQLNATFVSPDR